MEESLVVGRILRPHGLRGELSVEVRTDDPEQRFAAGAVLGTDLAGANAQGLDCLFIASGMHGEALSTNGALDSAKVDAALAAEGARATYVMSALR